MNHFRKKAFVLTATLLVGSLVVGWMSYTGYCFQEGRYLSEREKIEAAVSYVLNRYSPDIKYIKINEDGKDTRLAKPDFEMKHRYKDAKEFVELNPRCCEVGDRAQDGYKAPFMDRLCGYTSAFVHIKFDIILSGESSGFPAKHYDSYVAVSSCGHAWNG